MLTGEDKMSEPGASRELRLSRYRRVRVVVCLLDLAILIGALVYQGVFPGGLIVVLPLGGVPLLGYLAWVKSVPGSIVSGLALLGVTIGTALYVTERMETGSSTAAVGWLYLLFVGVPVLLVTVVVETLLGRRTRSSAP